MSPSSQLPNCASQLLRCPPGCIMPELITMAFAARAIFRAPATNAVWTLQAAGGVWWPQLSNLTKYWTAFHARTRMSQAFGDSAATITQLSSILCSAYLLDCCPFCLIVTQPHSCTHVKHKHLPTAKELLVHVHEALPERWTPLRGICLVVTKQLTRGHSRGSAACRGHSARQGVR